jgi:N-acetyl-alpha-D-muramate 1-phosphate uridylyltransferase
MKAMILAAGRGSRMLHLTELRPKPLLEVDEHTLIEHRIFALANAGIKDIVINVHYHAEQIIQYLGDGRKYNVNLHYSFEDECLGTGGGIKKALSLLGDQPFIVTSSDIFTDYDFAALLKHPVQTAHLVLVPNPDHHPKGDFHLDGNRVTSAHDHLLTYSGIALLHPKMFKPMQGDCFPITEVLLPAIARAKVTADLYQGEWINVDNLERLTLANSRVL